jgi:thiamine kinase-like enzyme
MELDDARLTELFDGVDALRGTRTVTALSGGLTNHNFKVDSAAGSFVVRISDPDTGLLAIDRDNEHVNSVAAAASGVAPAVVAYQPENAMLVIEYLDGTDTMSRETMQAGDRLGAAAAALRQLHAGPAFRDPFDMFRIQAGYREVCRERGFAVPDRYDDFEPQVRRLEQAMRANPEPLVPCNNDLLAENFLWDGTRFRLIDWEYSGMNEASFELGNVWSESDLSLAQLEELVGHYWGEASPATVARARMWGLMSKYGWTLWGVIQHNLSDIDFDFWEWLMDKHDRATLEFDGPDFDRLVADIESDER